MNTKLFLYSVCCFFFLTQTVPAQEVERTNRVIIMGMIHSKHRTSDVWSLDRVKTVIRRVDPDYVLCEIPPDRIEKANRQFKEQGRVTESRVAVFPEYVDALYPLTRELDFEIVPCAAWNKPMADSRRETLARMKLTRAQDYAEMEAGQNNAAEEIKKLGVVNDPAVIHTDAYDEIVRAGMEPYDRHFNEVIGEGGWTNINRGHYSLIEKALDSHRGEGKTLLITFGSWHKYYIKDQLRKRNDIKLVSLQEYLLEDNVQIKDWPRFRFNKHNTGSIGNTEISTPEVSWKFDTGGVIESSPAISGDSLFIGGHSKVMRSINLESGKQQWSFETGGWIRASPSVVKGVVYFGSDDNTFYAVDAKTGEEKWRFPLGEGGEQSSPAVVDGRVYFGGFDHFVYCLDAESGKKVWGFDAGSSMLSSPIVDVASVFIGTYGGKVFSIDRKTGNKQWEFQQNETAIYSSPLLVNGVLYFTSYDHHLYAVDATSGKLRWSYKTGNEIFSSPAFMDDTIYFGSNDGSVYALSMDGKLKWKTDLGSAVFASPTLTEGSVYVGDSKGHLVCLRRASGEIVWKHPVKNDSHVWSSVAAINGTLYFGSHAGEIVALKEKGGHE